MSKGILILDEMPKCCLHCQFAVTSEEGNSVSCTAAEKEIAESWLDLAPAEWDPENFKKPHWCPLHKLPEYEGHWSEQGNTPYHDSWADGYNQCLDDILGGEKYE